MVEAGVDVKMEDADGAGQDQSRAVTSAPIKQEDAAPSSAADQATQRSKKQGSKRKGRNNAAKEEEIALNATQSEYVRIVRVEPKKEAMAEDLTKVQLSRIGKAAQLLVSDDRMSVTGHKGFRTARASHGAHEGTWYCEVTVSHLGASGHVRLGWCTRKAELQAPVGFDKYGYSYRDLEGSKVHQGLREPYGSAYAQGDVIGLLLHLPPGGRPLEVLHRNVVRYKGSLHYVVEEPEPDPRPLQGSCLAFTRNGELQGVAYSDILEGTYYPAASLYTMPSQVEGATVTFNFGPDFKYLPPQLPDLPAPQPVSNLANSSSNGPAAAAEHAAAAAAGAQTTAAGAAAGGMPGAGTPSLTTGEAVPAADGAVGDGNAAVRVDGGGQTGAPATADRDSVAAAAATAAADAVDGSNNAAAAANGAQQPEPMQTA